MSPLQDTKMFLVENLHLAKDALHIYVALIIVIGSCLAFEWKVREWKPWLLVLLAALIGETWDIADRVAEMKIFRPWESVKDLWNTMLLPTVLLICARYSSIFQERSVSEEVESGDEAEVSGAAPRGESDIR